jgi:1,2-diacylglycerol 3-beta-galactosyltransferase
VTERKNNYESDCFFLNMGRNRAFSRIHVRIEKPMKRVHLIFFDAGGGHRSAANALSQVIQEQGRDWRIELVNLQELLDSLDVFRKLTGVRMQDIYNTTLKRGWTLGSPQMTRAMHGIIRLYHSQQVRLLENYWREHPSDLVVSLIPNFNRAIFQSVENAMPGVPMMTVLTDFADYPPHFWMEKQRQYLVCGTDKAVSQASALGYREGWIFRASGMILNPKFYDGVLADRTEERLKLGLDKDLPTGLVLFGGQGSAEMEEITARIDECGRRVQLILLCGHNVKLAERLRAMSLRIPTHIEGFTREVPYFMHISDFFIGKPGPGSISEATAMHLPVIVERNAWTLPQERYNADWIQEQGVGLVLPSFREIGAAVEELLDAKNYAGFQERMKSYENRAVFEIPEFMAQVMERGPASSKPETREGGGGVCGEARRFGTAADEFLTKYRSVGRDG